MSAARQIVVMGVSGTGKSVIGQALADRLDLVFIEGDAFHPAANIAKMSAGTPLDDDDRGPWLALLAGKLESNGSVGTGSVLACSALNRKYRDLLRLGAPELYFLHLDLPFDVLRERMERREHFMPTSLLQSQFDTLERLEGDELGHVLDFDAPLPEVIDAAVAAVTRT